MKITRTQPSILCDFCGVQQDLAGLKDFPPNWTLLKQYHKAAEEQKLHLCPKCAVWWNTRRPHRTDMADLYPKIVAAIETAVTIGATDNFQNLAQAAVKLARINCEIAVLLRLKIPLPDVEHFFITGATNAEKVASAETC